MAQASVGLLKGFGLIALVGIENPTSSIHFIMCEKKIKRKNKLTVVERESTCTTPVT